MENQQKNSAPENNSDNRNSNNNNNKKKPSKTVVIWIVSILLTFMIWQGITAIQQSKQEKITYDTFLQMLDDKLVTEVKLYNDRISFTPISKETGAEMDKTYYVIRISDYKIVDRLQKAGVQFEEMDEGKNAVVSTILSYVVMIGAFYLLMSLLMRNMSKSGGIGKSNDRYLKIGAKLPKGALLVGPPGTGKTLLAKAVAGEANVPFFSLSGSEFVEMFVGVGASRVRDLFRKANNMAPCIIFIDEIDAIGGKRDTRHGGGDSEREQTLNQLLSEMDGFDSSKGIIVLAATNRPEVLDKALLRPGRFDRRIIVSKPDMQGRIDTLKVHSKNVKMDETVDFKELALATSGAVGADLANIINEAALMAVRNKRDYVSQKDLIASVEVVFAGKEKKEKLLSPREKKIVAYHEVGHALVAALQKNTLPIQRITIVPRTSGALGYVWQVPEEEKQLQTKKEMEEDIVTFLAGRAAEELKFDSVTNGASNDIEKATSLARTMITMYGMSEKFGMVQLEGVTGEYLDNRRVLNCSSETETKVDTEVKNMMKASYEKAYKLLKKNMPTLDAIAQVLYEKENLSGKEFMELYEKYQNVKLTEAEKVQ